MRKTYCDKCGREIVKGLIIPRTVEIETTSGLIVISIEDRDHVRDLCLYCLIDRLGHLDKRPNKPSYAEERAVELLRELMDAGPAFFANRIGDVANLLEQIPATKNRPDTYDEVKLP